MNSCERPWLPVSALTAANVEVSLSKQIDIWIRDWIPRPVALSISTAKNGPTDPGQIQVKGEQAAITLTEQSLARFGARIANLSRPSGAAADTALYRKVALEAITQLAAGFGRPGAHVDIHHGLQKQNDDKRDARQRVTMFQLTADATERHGNWSLHIALGEDAIVTLRRGTGAKEKRIPPGSIAAATVAVPVPLTCSLGTVPLSVDELSQLCVGDVIILDALAGDAQPLVVRGTEIALAQGNIMRESSGICVRLTNVSTKQDAPE